MLCFRRVRFGIALFFLTTFTRQYFATFQYISSARSETWQFARVRCPIIRRSRSELIRPMWPARRGGARPAVATVTMTTRHPPPAVSAGCLRRGRGGFASASPSRGRRGGRRGRREEEGPSPAPRHASPPWGSVLLPLLLPPPPPPLWQQLKLPPPLPPPLHCRLPHCNTEESENQMKNQLEKTMDNFFFTYMFFDLTIFRPMTIFLTEIFFLWQFFLLNFLTDDKYSTNKIIRATNFFSRQNFVL